jgi:hypothetical protein
MPIVTLDHIQYRNVRVSELVAILIDDEYKTVKWIDQGSKSIQFMVTHEESERIGANLLHQFNAFCEHPIQFRPIRNDAFQQIRFIQKYDLGLLNQFEGFNDLIEDDVQLSLIIDNHYHLDGQLEISLVLSIDGGNIVIFDKWSTLKSKNCFKEIAVEVNPQIDNFIHRDPLLINLANEAFNDFLKSMGDLREFLIAARDFTLNGETLKAVYLDFKDRNRSLTNLDLSKENRDKIKNDLSNVNWFIRGRNQEDFSYVDFLRIIAKSPPQFYYNPQHEFEITTSRAYNSLLKKQKIFSYRNNLRFTYEEEQLHTLHQIEPIIR